MENLRSAVAALTSAGSAGGAHVPVNGLLCLANMQAQPETAHMSYG